MDKAKEKNYYELLGVDRDATTEHIKKAFHEIARIYHPDSTFHGNSGDDQQAQLNLEIFKKITAAYHTLIDEKRRVSYDRTLPKRALEERKAKDVTGEHRRSPEKPKRPRKDSAAFGIFGTLRDDLDPQVEVVSAKDKHNHPGKTTRSHEVHFARTAFGSKYVFTGEGAAAGKEPSQQRSQRPLSAITIAFCAFLLGLVFAAAILAF